MTEKLQRRWSPQQIAGLVAPHIDMVVLGLVALSLVPVAAAGFRRRGARRRNVAATPNVASLENVA